MEKSKNRRHPLSDTSLPLFPWPEPTAQDMIAADFNAIWNTIRTWDINVPEVYKGYGLATGNHVMAILIALGLRDKEQIRTEETYDIIQGKFSKSSTPDYSQVSYPKPTITK